MGKLFFESATGTDAAGKAVRFHTGVWIHLATPTIVRIHPDVHRWCRTGGEASTGVTSSSRSPNHARKRLPSGSRARGAARPQRRSHRPARPKSVVRGPAPTRAEPFGV